MINPQCNPCCDDERWAPLVESDARLVISTCGRVFDTAQKTLKIPHTDRLGYLRLGFKSGGQNKRALVHRLVLSAFKGVPPEGKPLGLHGDDNPSNAHLDNLRWGSHQDNTDDMVERGRAFFQRATHCPQGHEYTQENIMRVETRPRTRYCRTCHQDRKQGGLTPGDGKHGTASGYSTYGCRCDDCRAAWTQYFRDYRRKKKEKANK